MDIGDEHEHQLPLDFISPRPNVNLEEMTRAGQEVHSEVLDGHAHRMILFFKFNPCKNTLNKIPIELKCTGLVEFGTIHML